MSDSVRNSTYSPEKFEKKLYQYWLKGDWFCADETDTSKPNYTILIPPPNVTNRLHMGHGLNMTIQDILVRWKRMQGFNACWLPGLDHAGIATQMMVEKDLNATGVTRQELGREAFFARCVEWKEQYGNIILDQLKQLGTSFDWKRETYTMNEQLSKAVRKIFVDLYRDGLIYRGERLVNWDPVLKTAISDDEVENKEQNGKLWYYKFPVVGSMTDEHLVVATTRPETSFGDVCVAVHPEDTRYQHLIGKDLYHPLAEREIPVIADTYVKQEFGTGCVKITPAHDFNDFEVGKRHNFKMINIFNEDASLNELCPTQYQGMSRLEARKAVIKFLREHNYLVKEENHKNTLPISERSKEVVEPRLSYQWFLKMSEIVEPAIEAAKTDELKFYPQTWKKTYLHWLENIQDWCISRQLWWGHRIPMWECQDCQTYSTGEQDPSTCENCGSTDLVQDSDVLDTWFSSWLWPFSPFGWPEQTQALQAFFPSNVIVTGAEIIYLWVARMIIASYYTMGKLAFKDVYMNAIVCDKQGRKFSKTLGNGIDPIEMIDKYGADAVRFTCVSLAPLGGRVRMNKDDFEVGHRFINKIWNAAKYLLHYLDEQEPLEKLDHARLDPASKWLLNSYVNTCTAVNNHLEKYQINEAVDTLYHFVWGAFCDWGLESAKIVLTETSHPDRAQVKSTLLYVFEGILRLFSPVIPFVTEELWHTIPRHPDWSFGTEQTLMVMDYPTYNPQWVFTQDAQEWSQIQSLISGIRSVRTQANVPPKEKLCAIVALEDTGLTAVLQKGEAWIRSLAGINDLKYQPGLSRPAQSLLTTGKGWTVYVPVGDYLDVESECKRLQGEKKRIAGIVMGLQKKLQNKQFMERAPEQVITTTQAQYDNMSGQLKTVEQNLAALSEK